MTPAHRIETVLSEDGKLILDHLPFQAGQAVEVSVQPVATLVTVGSSLHGMVVRYDQPMAPVAETDWEALR